MYQLTVKVYNRHYDGDPSYRIESVLIFDSQLGYWLANKKTFSRELISYRHCD